MNIIRLSVISAFVALASTCGKEVVNGPLVKPSDKPSQEEPSDPTPGPDGILAPWVKGNLDIHFINSGRGECAFLIYPDGTQMVLDCGASVMQYDSGENLGYPQVGIYAKPDVSQVAGFWYARYIRKCMEWTGNQTIDYGLNTHFDGDHLGVGYAGYGITPPVNPAGGWYQTGFTYLLDNFKFGKMLDHGYPSYDYPYAQSGTVKTNCDNYRKCADYHQKNDGLKRELFVAGSSTQLAPVRDAASFPNFKVQNVFVNGTIWTGSGESTRELFPDKSTFTGAGAAKEASPSENSCSAVIKVSYGKFDYYGGGDAGFNGASNFTWKDVEGNVSKVVGQVDVMKATHHGSTDGCSQTLLTALAPSDIIVNVWQAVQPRAVTYERLISNQTNGGKSRIFLTNVNEDYKNKEYSDKGKRITAYGGHIVVRVAPGGDSYSIYLLDDTDKEMTMKVKSAFGPYKCK